MKSYTLMTAYKRNTQTPYVEFWKQPFFWWLVSKSYHRYEGLTEPIMKHVSRWHVRWFGKDDEEAGLHYVPLVNRRDIRCYHLSEKKKITLTVIELTKKQYDDILGRTRS